jgi:hypothetical protein
MKKVDKSSSAGITDDSSTNVEAEQVSQPIAKPSVSRSPLSVVRDAIRKDIPRLMQLKPYCEIIVPKDFSQQHFSYTIINILESNSYINNKKTWEGNILHNEMTQIVTVKNNAISYELERYAVKDCIWYGQEPMLNDVLEWLKIKNDYTDEYALTIGGDFLKMDFTQSQLGLINHYSNPRWDLSKPYLKDQSNKLIEFLAEEVV